MKEIILIQISNMDHLILDEEKKIESAYDAMNPEQEHIPKMNKNQFTMSV